MLWYFVVNYNLLLSEEYSDLEMKLIQISKETKPINLTVFSFLQASAMRAVNMGHEGALGLDHANVLQQHSVNGLASTNHSGIVIALYK